MSGNTHWIGPDETLKVGDFGFLIVKDDNFGGERWSLSDTPAHTNMSHEPRLNGWCGTYNDIATFARGMAKVVKIARNGRAQVVRLGGVELVEALEELGYPELIGDLGDEVE